MNKTDFKEYTVLIVEDDAMSYKFLDIVLTKKTGISIIWAIDGFQALDYCKLYQHIDIIITDIQLPVIDGYEIIRHIKSNYPHIPVIVQSANSFNNEMKKCYDLGCDAYMVKPLDGAKLIKNIESLLRPVASKTA